MAPPSTPRTARPRCSARSWHLAFNLSHIDKRPQGREQWTYTFFVDAVGHREDPVMAAAIEKAQAHCRELFILGSYPRSRRIL